MRSDGILAVYVTRRGFGACVPASGAGAGGPGTRSPAHARGRARRCAGVVSPTPQQQAAFRATANGACARMPKPPAPRSEVVADTFELTCRGPRWYLRAHPRPARFRSAVVVDRPEPTCRRPAVALAGAGPIRGRPERGVAEVVLTRHGRHAQVRARERGPENAGDAAGLTRVAGTRVAGKQAAGKQAARIQAPPPACGVPRWAVIHHEPAPC
jgi:hypothetical protein